MRHIAVACLAFLVGCRDGGGATAERAAAERASLAAGPPFPARLDLAAWVRSGPVELGCWMERTLAYRDPRWNCASRPVAPPVDPCGEGWRAGPGVPDAVARRMHPQLRRVALAWEHGALQSATFTFDPDARPETMPRVLGIGPELAGAVTRHGPTRCDTACYEVVVFAPSQPDCDEDGDEDDAEDGGAPGE